MFGTAGNATNFNNGNKYYTISVGAGPSATGYTLTATRKGDLANDPRCGNLVLTVAAGVATKTVSSGDPKYCWRQ